MTLSKTMTPYRPAIFRLFDALSILSEMCQGNVSTVKIQPYEDHSDNATVFSLRYRLSKHVSQSPLLLFIAQKINRPPQVLFNSLLLLFASFLLFDPNHIAPTLSDLLIFAPCFLSSLTYFSTATRAPNTSTDAQAEAHRTQLRGLVDCWMVSGGVNVVETLIGRAFIGEVMPLWWAAKVGMMIWVWSGAGPKGRGRPKPLVSRLR